MRYIPSVFLCLWSTYNSTRSLGDICLWEGGGGDRGLGGWLFSLEGGVWAGNCWGGYKGGLTTGHNWGGVLRGQLNENMNHVKQRGQGSLSESCCKA